MVAFRSLDEIALAMIDFLRLVNPDLDTKPGTVARDLFVDVPANELAKLYAELRNISNLQSLAAATGTDLDRLARNYGITRNTGSPAGGTVIFTTNDVTSDIFIPQGTIVTANSGTSFQTLVDSAFDSTKPNVYAANALRVRTDLDLAGITDDFALEVAVEANEFGAQGNVGKFSVSQVTLSGISNVTNVTAMTGGTGSESDAAFRSRALGIFAGANTGTALGYRNAVLADPRVLDVLTVEPGDTLMTRDGTQVGENDAGEPVVISSGTGGKVDLYTQGTDSESTAESFIYRDQSGRNDATDPANDFILGQRDVNPLLDFQQKRRLLIEQNQLPFQPVDRITTVSGTLSGPNFVQAFTDAAGNTQGSFELVKDEDAFGGSPFGFDRLRWISNTIDLTDEQANKGPFNGQDPLNFTDVSTINPVRQDVIISNENSQVDSSDRSILTLLHTPVVTVQRVENLTTGERYTIANQNFDGGDTNTTGRIQISGGTLPTKNDVLQVNYIWDLQFDDQIDFDDLQSTVFTRTVQDSVDWGFANRVEAEEETVLFSTADGYHIIVEHPISRVVNVNTTVVENTTNSAGKLTVANTIVNIRSIVDSTGQEVFFTREANGSFSGTEITLPTDSVLVDGATATVIYNVADVFSPDGYDTGTFSENIIRFQDGTVSTGDTVFADYVANVPTILPTTALSDLPVVGEDNQFVLNSNVIGAQPVSNEYSTGGAITRNLRFSPTYLRMNAAGISSTGRLTIRGTNWTKIDTTVTVRNDGLEINLAEAATTALGVSSLPTTSFVALVDAVEQVTLSGTEISSTDATLDLLNHKLLNIQYSNGKALQDTSLNRFTVKLSETDFNLSVQPNTGDVLRVVFYIADTRTTENITVSAAGTIVSSNRYIFVERMAVSSGFVGLSGNIDGTVNIQAFTQPVAGATYFSSYQYTAPKEGERITVNYDYNRLVGDVTFLVEDVRPITADVLVKGAGTIGVDVSLEVIPVPNFTQSNETLRQNVIETVTNFLTSGGLGAVVDASDIINVVYTVDGVDRVEILTFNENGNTGVRRTLTSGRDKFFSAGVVDATIGSR